MFIHLFAVINLKWSKSAFGHSAGGIESLPLAHRYKQIERLPNPGREL